MKLRAALLLPLLLVFASKSAHARKVEVEWKEIKGAVQYQIQIQKNGKVVSDKTSDDHAWAGKLDFGLYSYQIRAYDKAKRPGVWSTAKALVVMPAPPVLSLPEDGKKIRFYTADGKTRLQWQPVAGVDRYAVKVSNGGKVVHDEVVTGTQLDLKNLNEGSYSWQVVTIVEAKGRTPSSLEGRKWESKPSDRNDFVMVHEKLATPEVIYPIGKVRPPEDNKLQFKWSAVEGAQRYEVRLVEKSVKGRNPAEFKLTEVTLSSNTNTLVAKVTGEGSYSWEVRALAAINESNVAEAMSTKSSAEFILNRNADFFEGAGYLAFSTMVAPYSYHVSGGVAQLPQSDTGGSVGATFKLSGEYYPLPQVGFGAAVSNAAFTIDDQTFNRVDLEASVKYRVNVTNDKYAWFFSSNLGFLSRDYDYIPITSGPATFTTIGPVLGFDLRKQLSEKFSLGSKFAYYFPVASSDGTVLHGDPNSNRNVSLGIQGLYWLSHRWGLAAGAFLEERSIAEAPNGAPKEVINQDGTYFYGSVIWSFGR